MESSPHARRFALPFGLLLIAIVLAFQFYLDREMLQNRTDYLIFSLVWVAFLLWTLVCVKLKSKFKDISLVARVSVYVGVLILMLVAQILLGRHLGAKWKMMFPPAWLFVFPLAVTFLGRSSQCAAVNSEESTPSLGAPPAGREARRP
jgi:hypothetical protein